jgi:hypothetical protein
MKSTGKRDRRRLVLKREQVRQLNTGQLARMLGAVTTTYSAGPCTESCAGCTQTTAPTSTQICAD